MDQNLNNKNSSQYTRKKIEEYSYGLNDVIGKGYSSQVYKGRHDQSGTSSFIQNNLSPSKSSIWKCWKIKSTAPFSNLKSKS